MVEVLAYSPGKSGKEPLLVEAGGLFFTSSIQAEDASLSPTEQFDRCYRRIDSLLAGHGSVVRLDHFVQSQSSLGERQKIRAAHFGLPAPIASTGVRTSMLPDSFLNVSAVACSEDLEPSVLVDGESYGMAFISSAVKAGGLIFISGILVKEGADPVGECFGQIAEILDRCGVNEEHIVRQDVYARDEPLMSLAKQRIGGVPNVSLINEFDGESVLEVTTIASVEEPKSFSASKDVVAARRAGEWLFTDSYSGAGTGAIETEIAIALEATVNTVERGGFDQTEIARIDVVVTDPKLGSLVSEEIARRLPTGSPVVVWRAGSTTGRARVELAAISHR